MRLSHFLRGSVALLSLSVVTPGTAPAQVLFNNGPAADAGLSVIRAGGTLFGAGAQSSIPNVVADNFSVGGLGWNVTGFSFFAYQTFAASQFTFTSLTWSIVSGDINVGPTVASGTVVPTNGGLQGYRVTAASPTNQDRAIFQLDADVADFALGAGDYWLTWGIAGSAASGPWQPPTADGAVGNAVQSLAGGAFNQVIDAGDGLGVEMPFIVRGTRTTTAVPEPSSLAMMLVGGIAMVGVARRRRLSE